MAGETSTQPPPAVAPPEWKYDVFVSFRGEDKRKSFMSHLFRAFERAEISCYRDVDWDQRGRIVGPMLLEAIRGSRIALVLFTTHYSNSRWCLDELVEIMNCDGQVYRDHGHMVVPIFFDVEATDVRRQQGEFGRWLESSAAKQGEAKAAAWRAALYEAGNRSGLHLQNDANGDESLLIEKIVGQIFSKTAFRNSPYFIKDAVGIDDSATAVISLLDISSSHDVRIIGLHGTKGIGKTTLARLVCSRVYSKFEGVSFLENIGDAKKGDIIKFQKRLLNDVLKVKHLALDEQYSNRNLGLMRDKLRNRKVLLVLDDVNEKNIVTLLAGGRGGLLAHGSRILITTKDESLLDDLKVDCKCMVSGLGETESLQLFGRYAFHDGDGDQEGCEELSRNLVHYAGGLPSAIITLGTWLFERKKDQWNKLLQRLERNPILDYTGECLENADSFLHPSESVVGPCGEHGGSSFDDKAYSGIRQMEIVVFGPVVGSIRIDYDHNGSLVRSCRHGESHEGQTSTVTLDYPDEYLTSISGCSNTNLCIIQSLSIHSNRRKYGPFGDENGNPFSFHDKQIKDGKILGFFGKCGSYVNSIGAYIGPISHPYPFKTIGPFGNRDGNSWDDGKHPDIRQINVVFDTEVESISIIYDNHGHRTIPFTHGEKGGGEFYSVRLAYPYEYLRSISGYLREHLGRLILQSISFNSNTRKYGPFGREVGIPFSGPSTGGKIVGFYGSCNGHLDSIGAYLEPVSHKHPMRTVGPFGGDGGSPWDDGRRTGLRQIIIRCGSVIDSIKCVYDDNGTSSDGLKHGADGGSHSHTIELDCANEYITSISGYFGEWGPMDLLYSLTFRSNKRVYGPYGPEQGTYFSSPPNTGKIVGLYGRSGQYLDCIGAYFAPAFDHLNPANTVGPFGGGSGDPWDDEKHRDVQQIFLSYGTVIDGMCCIYDKGKKSAHRGGSGGCSYTIELDCPNEYLTSISGYTGDFLGTTVVRSLTFQSNKKTHGPFGYSGGTPFSFTTSTGKLVGFYGLSGRYINSIGAYVDHF
ncbi:jacalin-related lectin 4-like [Punica granatum]|uniref:Jacalin-related lectin 4-like n=1 Tax=Punica granatum TaxID=22663 RepID=A0A6P8E9C9_PUNGR|nr:jacalin-related lectin 4-like [Punica granatum]